MAEKCKQTGIFDLPKEVLINIISLLTPRERLPLGDSCHRFKSLVFEDSELVRNLDFSKKACLTTIAQIRRYLNNENACEHVRRINLRNVKCMKAGDVLNNSVGKAINLVDLDIRGTEFEDIWQLRYFLNLMRHLEKLSINWPKSTGDDISLCRRTLQRSFSKLTCLSVTLMTSALTMFTSTLSLCQQLKELHIRAIGYDPEFRIHINSSNSEIKKLRNLKIVHYDGCLAIKIKEQLVAMLPDPEQWTDFDLFHVRGFYIEKDLEVCEELLRSEKLKDIFNTAPYENFKLKWALDPACLLKEVVRITHEDTPENWCCLSTYKGTRRPLLKIEEAKLLLKDPWYQISYLHLDHDLEYHCDAYLLVSAFPNLSELVLHALSKDNGTLTHGAHLPRRLNRRGSPTSDNETHHGRVSVYWSLEMLVANIPNLKHLTVDSLGFQQHYNTNGLYYIMDWRNLETLQMRDIPWHDDQFMIGIGRECKNLRKLTMRTDYLEENEREGVMQVDLFRMFEYCRNLRELTLGWYDINQSELFNKIACKKHRSRKN